MTDEPDRQVPPLVLSGRQASIDWFWNWRLREQMLDAVVQPRPEELVKRMIMVTGI